MRYASSLTGSLCLVTPLLIYRMNTPANLHYTKDHEWISVDGDTATIGITDHAQREPVSYTHLTLPTKA